MTPRPTITIAIPSYNKAPYIRRCIESVLQNADAIDRIIVVDNASTDETFAIAQEYEPRVTCYRNETNIGMSGNFNRCVELCDTDWLMIFHADDEMLSGAITHYRDVIEQHPSIGLIHANCFFVQDADETTRTYVPRPTYGFFASGADAMSCHYGACSSIMVKREAYTTLGVFIESMSPDVEMWARIASHYDVYSLDVPTVVYHVSAASTGPQSLVNRSIREIRADWDALAERMAANYPTPELQEAFRRQNRMLAPANYWTVVKANIRARKVRNTFQGLWLIVVTYRGLIPLIKLVGKTIARRYLRSPSSRRTSL